MPVVDVTGRRVGTIKSVHATLPSAQKRDVGIHHQLAPRLLRVAGAGLMDNDCYVSAEQIAVADEDQVVLLVTARELTIDDGRWI